MKLVRLGAFLFLPLIPISPLCYGGGKINTTEIRFYRISEHRSNSDFNNILYGRGDIFDVSFSEKEHKASSEKNYKFKDTTGVLKIKSKNNNRLRVAKWFEEKVGGKHHNTEHEEMDKLQFATLGDLEFSARDWDSDIWDYDNAIDYICRDVVLAKKERSFQDDLLILGGSNCSTSGLSVGEVRCLCGNNGGVGEDRHFIFKSTGKVESQIFHMHVEAE